MAIKLVNLPPPEFGAKLDFNSNEDLRVVYRPSEQVPDSYEFHDLWYPEQDYPDGYVAVPFSSTFFGIDSISAGTVIVNVEGSTRDPKPKDKNGHKYRTWRHMMQDYNLQPCDTCCAETDVIYDSITGQTDESFECTNNGNENESKNIFMQGAHVLKDKTTYIRPKDDEKLYIVPLCKNHNIYSKNGYKSGSGYYMKLRRDQDAIVLINFMKKEVIQDAILKEELK